MVLVSDRIRCLIYLPFALQLTVCFVPSIVELLYLSFRFSACIAWSPHLICCTQSTILEYAGSRKLEGPYSMACPIDTIKPAVTPADDESGETIFNVTDTTGIFRDASDSEGGGEVQPKNAKGRTPAQEAMNFYPSLACSKASPILETGLIGRGNHFPVVESELHTTNVLAVAGRPETLEGPLVGP